jgi:hypothetical protein
MEKENLQYIDREEDEQREEQRESPWAELLLRKTWRKI